MHRIGLASMLSPSLSGVGAVPHPGVLFTGPLEKALIHPRGRWNRSALPLVRDRTDPQAHQGAGWVPGFILDAGHPTTDRPGQTGSVKGA